jgi:hypothetical protein
MPHYATNPISVTHELIVSECFGNWFCGAQFVDRSERSSSGAEKSLGHLPKSVLGGKFAKTNEIRNSAGIV